MIRVTQKTNYKKVVIESLAYFRNRTYAYDIHVVDSVIKHVQEENLFVTDIEIISKGLNAAMAKYKINLVALEKSNWNNQDKEILIPYYREMMNDTTYLLTKIESNGTRFLQ